MFKKYSLYLLLLILFSFSLSACNKKKDEALTESEVHNCNEKQGFLWCEEKDKCLKPSEEDCSQVPDDAAKAILDSSISFFDSQKITIDTDQKLKWSSEQGTDPKEYSSRSIRIEETNYDVRNLLSKHLLDSGFKIDPNNVSAGTIASSTGYQKGNLVCQLIEGYQGDEETVKKGLGKLYLQLLCAEI